MASPFFIGSLPVSEQEIDRLAGELAAERSRKHIRYAQPGDRLISSTFGSSHISYPILDPIAIQIVADQVAKHGAFLVLVQDHNKAGRVAWIDKDDENWTKA